MYKITTEVPVTTTQVKEVEVTLCGFIGHQIKEDRVKADLNIRQLADRLNKAGHAISKSTVGLIEKGNESLKLTDLAAIAKFFGRDIIYYLPSAGEKVDSIDAHFLNPQTVE